MYRHAEVIIGYAYTQSPYFTVRVNGVEGEVKELADMLSRMDGVARITPGGSLPERYVSVFVYVHAGVELEFMASSLFAIATQWLDVRTVKAGQSCESCGMRATKIQRGVPACDVYPTCGPGH